MPVAAIEDRPKGEQLVQRCAQGIDIRAMVYQAALRQDLFGTGIAQRAHELAGHGQAGTAAALGQAEVRDP